MACASCFSVCIDVIIKERIFAQVFFTYEYFETKMNSVSCPAH